MPGEGTAVRASVRDGCVRLDGRLAYQSQAERLADAVSHLPGVVAVDCRVEGDVDDLHLSLLGG